MPETKGHRFESSIAHSLNFMRIALRNDNFFLICIINTEKLEMLLVQNT